MRHIAKEFSFEYAHRLMLPYKSKCENLHGHTGHVMIRLYTNSEKLEKTNMMVDFTFLKPFVDYIIDIYDHTTLVNENDLEFIKFIQQEKISAIQFNGNPTSEVIAEDIAYKLVEFLNKEIFTSDLIEMLNPEDLTVEVIFKETDTSSASYSNDYLTILELIIEEDSEHDSTKQSQESNSKDVTLNKKKCKCKHECENHSSSCESELDKIHSNFTEFCDEVKTLFTNPNINHNIFTSLMTAINEIAEQHNKSKMNKDQTAIRIVTL